MRKCRGLGTYLLQWGLWQWPALQVDGLRGKLRVQWGNCEGNRGPQRAPLQLTHLMSIQTIYRITICTTITKMKGIVQIRLRGQECIH